MEKSKFDSFAMADAGVQHPLSTADLCSQERVATCPETDEPLGLGFGNGKKSGQWNCLPYSDEMLS